MCLILFALDSRPDYPLVLAANRDEFYDRPTAPCRFWRDEAGILAGRDLKGGGTWLGITPRGRLAAITNYREPVIRRMNPERPTRGRLVSEFLMAESPAARPYLTALSPRADRYDGFNLLLRDTGGQVFWFSNRMGKIMRVAPGVHGLSNHLLDTPWPKVERGQTRLASILSAPGRPDIEALFSLLGDRLQPAPQELPDTGVGMEWERLLAPIYVRSPIYGTRSSTVVTISGRGHMRLYERTYHFKEGEPAGCETVTFDLTPQPLNR